MGNILFSTQSEENKGVGYSKSPDNHYGVTTPLEFHLIKLVIK